MDEEDDRVWAAGELAREVAPDLDAILVTIYPDADTLDTIRPGDADVAAANAVARAVAEAMSEEGVEVFVQRADRGAFRRWLAQREDTPEARRGWVDRGRLLRGGDAFRALSLEAPPPEPPPNTQPCNQETRSGGRGITQTRHYLGPTPGRVTLAANTLAEPDRIRVHHRGRLLSETPGFVQGPGTISFDWNPPPGGSAEDYVVTVEVTGTPGSPSTVWFYTLGCPGGASRPGAGGR